MELYEYNEEILSYYTKISSNRNEEFPVFAIEHGLTYDEIIHITELLNDYSDIEDDIFYEKHKFVWIAVATEIGYEYEGHDYWPLFDLRFKKITKKYKNYKDGYRYRLRNWFYNFNQEFRGFKPTGDWAQKFSVISYPITNSILPKQFQNYLVEALYYYRDPKDISDGSFEKIFKYLAIDFRKSQLFSKFVTEGNLIRVLLNEIFKLNQNLEIIDKLAFDRIIQDIRKNELTKHRFKILIDRVSRENEKTQEEKVKELHYVPTLSIKKSLSNDLELYAEIPSLENISDEFTEFLKKDKIIKISLSKKPFFTSTFLRNNNFKIENIEILKEAFFNESNLEDQDKEDIDKINNFLKEKFSFINYDSLLFEIVNENEAILTILRNIQLNQKYFLLIKNSLATTIPNSYILSKSNFGNFNLLEIFVNEEVLRSMNSWTDKYNLTIETNFELQTIGVLERGNNKNFFEFLEEDNPIFILSNIHQNQMANEVTKRFKVELNEKLFYIPVENDEHKVYFQINSLENGVSNLSITRQTQIGHINYSYVDRQKILRKIYVRKKIENFEYDILFLISNKEYTYTELFNENIDLNIYGPENSLVDLYFEFRSLIKDGSINIPIKKNIKLPILENDFQKILDEFKKNHQEDFKDFDNCKLIIDGRDLGLIGKDFEDEVKSLRLLVQKRNNTQTLFYIDNSGIDFSSTDIPKVEFLNFQQPDEVYTIDVSDNLRDEQNENLIKINPKTSLAGGCYIIKKRDEKDQLIEDFLIFQPELKKKMTLSELNQINQQSKPLKNDLPLLNFFQLFKYWKEARCFGFVVNKNRVIDTFINYLYTKLYPNKFLQIFKSRTSISKKFLVDQLVQELSQPLRIKILYDHKFNVLFEENSEYKDLHSLNMFIEEQTNVIKTSFEIRNFCLNLAFKPENLYKEKIPEMISIIPSVINQNSDFLKLSKILSIALMSKNEFRNNQFLFPRRSIYDNYNK